MPASSHNALALHKWQIGKLQKMYLLLATQEVNQKNVHPRGPQREVNRAATVRPNSRTAQELE